MGGLAMAGVVLGACSAELYLPPPSADGARSVLLFTQSGGRVELHARSSGEDFDRFLISTEDPVELVALLYAETLEQLGIPSGRVTLSAEAGAPLYTPLARREASVSPAAGGPLAWREADPVIDGPLAELRVDARGLRCERFQYTNLGTGQRSGAAFLAPDRDGALVFGNKEGGYGALEPHAPSVLVALEPEPALRPTAGFAAEPGRIYVGGLEGAVYLARVDRDVRRLSLDPVAELPSTGEFVSLSGGEGPDGLELVGLSESDELTYHDGREARVVHLFPQGLGPNVDRLGAVLWLEPGHFLAVGRSSPELLRFQGGVLRWEPLTVVHSLITVAVVPGLGEVVGGSNGTTHLRRPGGRWELLPGALQSWYVYRFLPYPEGFLQGGTVGRVEQYIDGLGFCDAHQLGSGPVRHLERLGGAEGLVVAFSDGSDRIESTISVLRPIR